MDVKFTGSWYDEQIEKTTAEALIKGGCKLISQHADSMGAPTACKEANIPNVTYNVSTEKECRGTYIVGSRINWAPYFEFMVNSAINNTEIPYDWTGTVDGGSVELLELGSAAAEGTQAKLDEVAKKLKDGTLNVFDTKSFTVGGKEVTTFMADVDDDGTFTADTEVIKDGVLMESKFRSAPYFTLDIDGITTLK